MPVQNNNLILKDNGNLRTVDPVNDEIEVGVPFSSGNLKRGTGDPNGVVDGNEGDIYQMLDPGDGRVFLNTDGTNTGWIQVATGSSGVGSLADTLLVGNTTGPTSIVVSSGSSITGVNAPIASNIPGGGLTLVSGSGDGPGFGGTLLLASGNSNSGAGGNLILSAGATVSGVGGGVTIQGGNSNVEGGNILMQGGSGGAAFGGGDVSVRGGNAASTGKGGDLYLGGGTSVSGVQGRVILDRFDIVGADPLDVITPGPGRGLVWVDNSSPTNLWFRDDAGNNFQLNGPSGGTLQQTLALGNFSGGNSIFMTGSDHILRPSGSTSPFQISGGENLVGNGGALTLSGGNAGPISNGGSVIVSGGSGGNQGGVLIFQSGTTGATGNTGQVILRSSNTSQGNSGPVTISTGNTSSGTSGFLQLSTGAASSGGTPGNMTLTTGGVVGGSANAGNIQVEAGSISGGGTGNGGNITLVAGNAPFGSGGIIDLIVSPAASIVGHVRSNGIRNWGRRTTNPTTPTPQGGDFYYHTGLRMYMEYDEFRSRWLSRESHLFVFSRPGVASAGNLLRFGGGTESSVAPGLTMMRTGTIIGIHASRFDLNEPGILTVIQDFASVATFPFAPGDSLITNLDISIDFLQPQSIGVGLPAGSANITNPVATLEVKWRVP